MEHAPRWAQLKRTSPSGKTLFICLDCERISVTPDKVCRDFPELRQVFGTINDVKAYRTLHKCSLKAAFDAVQAGFRASGTAL